MLPQWIIEKKRDGAALTADEIREFIEGYTRGTIPDYQMAALAMAIYFRGLSADETVALTEAMLRSGDVVDTASIAAPKVDKHSTGGIGDKVSLLLAPLVACCGVAVPMISGRGLGLTGGTLDKLEAIPGYRTQLPTAEFLLIVAACGCSIIGQTERLAPADRKLYALRDVTGTVASIPLITASILSKKLAAGVDGLVLDVKCGRGAFMPTPAAARELAHSLVRVGRQMGQKMAALITGMDQPLGRAVGNALEVVEAIAALQGRGPDDLLEVTLALAERMLLLAGVARNAAEAGTLLARQLESGAAWEKFLDMVRRHGGDVAALEHPDRLPRARLQESFPAPASGFVAAADAEYIGRACLLLGAGRAQITDTVDPAVGVADLVKIGEP
ncbi:MAG: thymidine phosphorylase, partial [Kiritimatiellaeota bacterium]|nr:thymidine phosphorylase [Kiritimatiellota bacterium]